MTLTNQNNIHDEIKSRLNSGNACYHSVQNLLPSHLILKQVKITIYKIVILPVVLYGCKTSSLTLREEYRLSIFDNIVLRKMDHGENCTIMNFIICILHLILFFLLSLAPQPSLGLGLLPKIRLNFLEASQQFSFFTG
jgi:hypothetical protein